MNTGPKLGHWRKLLPLALLAGAAPALASGSNVIGENLLWLAIIILAARLFDTIAKDPIIMFMAELGVIILLLQIGLETRLGDLVSVGVRASAVGAVGIVVPFALGAFVVGPLLLPGMEFNTYLFLGATLAATSVGIGTSSARVA